VRNETDNSPLDDGTSGDSRDRPAHRVSLVPARRAALTSLGSIEIQERRPIFAFLVIITTERKGNFASKDTHFLEKWSRSGLRSHPGFFVAGALRGLLRAVS